MTRVLFDGYWWAQGPGANRMVMRELINAWSKHYPEDELIIAVRHRHRDQVLDAPRGVQLAETRLWPQAASNVVELPMLARRHRADVVVCHNYAPVTGASVVFVHDLLFRDHPEWFSRAERLYFDLMPVTSKRASTVVTSSEAESDRIRRITQRREVPAVGLAVPRELADCAAEPVPLEHERFALIVNPTGAETFNSHAVEASICNIPGLADRFVYFNDDFFIGRPVDPDFYFPGGFAYANPLPSYIATRDMHAHGMLNAVGAINEHFTRKEYFAGLSRGFRRRLISDGVRLPLTLTSKRIPPVGDVHLPTPLVTDIVREAFRADAARIEETRRSV